MLIGKPPELNKNKQQENIMAEQDVGLDIGTMNIIAARQNKEQINTSSLRNVFLKIDKNIIGNFDTGSISHVVVDDELFILSEDAYNFANIFSKEVSRPMSKGMISTTEIDAIDILSIMIKELIGTSDGTGKCVYSVPANPIDREMNIIYHQNVFNRIIEDLGFQTEALNESIAIIYSECVASDFSGIAISFGAGMCNAAVVYKAVPVITFSVAKGGDYIDQNAAISTGTTSNRANLIKETRFDLTNFNNGIKKDRRVKEALVYYYNSLIDYVARSLIQQLNSITVELPEHLPMVIAGGTSLATNFVDFFKDKITQHDFPIAISDIQHARNPLTVVAEGCLIKALKK